MDGEWLRRYTVKGYAGRWGSTASVKQQRQWDRLDNPTIVRYLTLPTIGGYFTKTPVSRRTYLTKGS